MKTHTTKVIRIINLILRKLFKLEITSLIYQDIVIGYGIRKQIK